MCWHVSAWWWHVQLWCCLDFTDRCQCQLQRLTKSHFGCSAFPPTWSLWPYFSCSREAWPSIQSLLATLMTTLSFPVVWSCRDLRGWMGRERGLWHRTSWLPRLYSHPHWPVDTSLACLHSISYWLGWIVVYEIRKCYCGFDRTQVTRFPMMS